jgi:hypothetical protein
MHNSPGKRAERDLQEAGAQRERRRWDLKMHNSPGKRAEHSPEDAEGWDAREVLEL